MYTIRKKEYELVQYIIRDGKQVKFEKYIRYPDTILSEYFRYISSLTYGEFVNPQLASDPSP